MSRQNLIQSNFTSGEVSPLIAGRLDAKVYANGLRTCENFYVRPQGPACLRGGTRHVKPSKIHGATSRLVPFEFSDLQAYTLQFGASAGTAITTVTSNGGLFRITSAGHGLVTGDTIRIYDSSGFPTLNRQWTVTKISSSVFDLQSSVFSGSGEDYGTWVRTNSGFIHLFKNGEPLMETTTTEIEAFETDNATGFTLIEVDVTPTPVDLPGWGAIFTNLGVGTNNGTITVSDSGVANGVVGGLAGNKVRITTSVPHTLRTGQIIFVISTEIPDSASQELNGQFTVTRLNGYSFDVELSTYGAPVGGYTVFFTPGVIAGDRVYVSGASDYPSIGNKWHYVHAVGAYDNFTLATPFVNHGGTPDNEELWTIPIEIITPYTEADLPELRVVQSADVLYILHPNYAPRKLVRLDNDGDREDWLLATVNFVDGPYLPLNDLAPNVNTTTPANGSVYLDVYFELSSYTHTATATCVSRLTATLDDNGGNYRVTTQVAHGLTTGQLVIIAGTGTTADGNRVATVLTSTTFSIATAFGSVGAVGTVLTPFANADDNDFIEYRAGDQWRLAQLGNVADYDTSATVSIIDNVLLYLDSTTILRNTPSQPTPTPGTDSNSGSYSQRSRRDGGSRVFGNQPVQRVDPNNEMQSGQTDGTAGVLSSQYAGTFGTQDVGKYVRYVTKASATADPVARWALIQSIITAQVGRQAKHLAAVTMAANTATGNFVISNEARSATLTAYRAGSTFAAFASTDIGRLVRLGWAGRWTWGKITAYTSTSQVTVAIYEDVPRDPHDARKLAGTLNGTIASDSTAGRTYDWRMGSWSETTGYPSTATFHEQRLVFARTDTQPATFWGSITGDFENMRPTELDSTVLDDNAIAFTLASGRINAIKWMESGTSLVIGTNGGEWLARSSSATQEPITPTNITVTQQSRNGSAVNALPLRIGNGIVFVDRSEQKVLEVAYLYSEDRLEEKDLSIVSEHMIRTGGTVVQTAYQKNPHCISWFLLSDGTLAAMTYVPDQEVIAWHHHELSGTGAFVESICVVPSEDGTHDVLHLLVKRTINSSTFRSIEVLTPEFYPSGSSRIGQTFLDACITEGFTNFTTSIKGLWHLEGEVVTVTVDGTVRNTYTVASGTVTIGNPAPTSEFVVGLAYTGTLKSLPPEGGSRLGTSQGFKKKIAEMKVRVFNTFGFNYGARSTVKAIDLTASPVSGAYRNEGTTPYFTGTIPVNPMAPADEESPWAITATQPYPCNIVAVILVVESEE